ncbi:MAG: tRNA (adenosine(37)-N6)-dimethylallyltransferase MiaA, partial [Firmicutes bacterium]|nr:tRNA (adenosine(37)-N6)-dimethylallyltransferase MiaA [Bacillota bacterium]
MNKLVVIAGPTACGKTAVSVETAKIIGGEVISADSMQVYKYMDIGTAKIKREEMQGINHYLIDEFYPDEEYNISVFKKRAKKYIDDIHSRNKIPMIVGGTGFYINAAVKDTEFEEEDTERSYREELEKAAKEKGYDYIYDMLKACDPQ